MVQLVSPVPETSLRKHSLRVEVFWEYPCNTCDVHYLRPILYTFSPAACRRKFRLTGGEPVPSHTGHYLETRAPTLRGFPWPDSDCDPAGRLRPAGVVRRQAGNDLF